MITFKAYRITNTQTGKFYIGITVQSLSARWKSHRSDQKVTRNTPLRRAIVKYGAQAFVIAHIASARTRADLLELEAILISQEGSFIGHGKGGYNATLGGEGGNGTKHTAETRAKQAASKIGNKHAFGQKRSDETKAKMSVAKKGKARSAASIAKSVATRRARERTPAERAAMVALRASVRPPQTPAQIERVRQQGFANRGHKWTAEQRKRLSDSMRASPKAREHIQRVNAKNLERWRMRVACVDLEAGG